MTRDARASWRFEGSGGPISGAIPTVHVVLPDGTDDPARPSGGNTYDRRLCAGLPAAGWSVRELVVPGPWPRPDAAALSRLARAVASLPDGGLVLLDGLIASPAAAVLVPEAPRLRQVVLVHMPLGDVAVAAEAECAVLAHARAVVTTSAWTRNLLLERYRLPPGRVHVARPGAERGPEAPGTPGGGRLLSVGAVAPHKGHDLLLDALCRAASPGWHWTVVGPLDRDPAFVERLRRSAAESGLADRICFAGPLAGEDLRRQYQGADVLVLPSRLESYGMVATEALAAGLPVVATAVGGVPEALGRTADGVPGLLVPPDDPAALAAALATWWGDARLRNRLRRAARARRRTLEGWATTAGRVAAVLAAVGEEPGHEPGRALPGRRTGVP